MQRSIKLPGIHYEYRGFSDFLTLFEMAQLAALGHFWVTWVKNLFSWVTPSGFRAVFLLCKSIAKQEMCHFLAPAGQPEMMHKNFMRQHLRIFVVQCSCMKFYAFFRSSTSAIHSEALALFSSMMWEFSKERLNTGLPSVSVTMCSVAL